MSESDQTFQRGAMLEKWADTVTERRMIEEFWAWICRRHVPLSIINLERELDYYYGIDRERLERERGELFERAKTLGAPVYVTAPSISAASHGAPEGEPATPGQQIPGHETASAESPEDGFLDYHGVVAPNDQIGAS